MWWGGTVMQHRYRREENMAEATRVLEKTGPMPVRLENLPYRAVGVLVQAKFSRRFYIAFAAINLPELLKMDNYV